MRKETIAVRIFLIFLTLYVFITIYKLIRKNPHKPSSNPDSPYTIENVYSKPMTKLEIRNQLGRSTWTLLHTMAAVYPGVPSAQHKKDVISFIYLLSKLYPCGDCASHFQKMIAKMPPKVNNHDEFAAWMCNCHNVVNKRLGKEEFDCGRVDDRWECGCNG